MAAALFGLMYLQRSRSSGGLADSMANGTLGRFPQASMDMGVMGESGRDGGGYEPPAAENTSLLSPDPEDDLEARDLEQQT